MKTWLKGGLIGAFLGVIQPFVLIYAPPQLEPLFPEYYESLWNATAYGAGYLGIIILTLVFIILFFIIGAIIGLIIQKLKK